MSICDPILCQESAREKSLFFFFEDMAKAWTQEGIWSVFLPSMHRLGQGGVVSAEVAPMQLTAWGIAGQHLLGHPLVFCRSSLFHFWGVKNTKKLKKI